ncbi:hypothetical protein HFD88_004466 [Aspergillus terreus]|nr:hypothetical protein HFD88_004466 [Aspergillus terreus]
MGIPGLINAIGSGERISLSKLAITHLERTARPIRIAVDISIWLFQVQAGRGGRNPELRTLFYRLLKFLALPIHPLFVYDGREKPPFKRGKATGGSYGNAPIVRLSKILVDLFKFPRHNAPGEAEAECARLQRAGVVDCVMSNDVDALMFGSTLTIMNFSKEGGSGPATHVTCYNMGNSDIPSTVSVDRAGMILFAMLSGGDYLPSGVPKCGSKLAAEIARAGFGADLMEAVDCDGPEVDERLSEWRERLQYELEENESGYFQTKHKAVRIPETFPDKAILSYYAKPVVSTDNDIEHLQRRLMNAWDQEIDVMELRQFTADAFEWNYRSGARKVIRLLAEPLVSHRLRLQRRPFAFPDGPMLSNNPTPMFQKVYKSRTVYSTDGMSELQLDYIPIDIVGLDLLAEEPNPPMPSQESTASGDEDEADAEEEVVPTTLARTRVTKRYDPYEPSKIWIFETVAMRGIPEIVEKWKKEQAEKASAVNKPRSRKTGPRKKGPIDPGMKQGSILKYGTLRKESSNVSQFKNAQLFEAAVSATPTKHTSSQLTPYSPQYMASLESPVINDLNAGLTSACNIVTPRSDIKRHPMLSQSRASSRRRVVVSGDGGVEAEIMEMPSPSILRQAASRRLAMHSDVEAGTDFLEVPSPSVSRKIRMSYLNASCATDDVDFTTPSPTPKRSNRRNTTKDQMDDLRDILSPLKLKDGASQLERDPSPSPVAPTTKRKSQRLARKAYAESNTMEESGETSPPRIQDLLEAAALDMRSLHKRWSKKTPPPTIDLCEENAPIKEDIKEAPKTPVKKPSSRKTKSQETSSHMRSVVVNDGYWTTESTPEPDRELDSRESDTVNRAVDGRSARRGGRKKIPRVSIVDLTES